MAQLFKNNAQSSLSAAMTISDTALFVQPSHGSRFPTISGADYFYMTLENAAGNIEVVKITAHSAGASAMTCVRAQVGTTARAWSINDLAEMRLTEMELTRFERAALRDGDTYTGNHNYTSGNYDFSAATVVIMPPNFSIGTVSAAEISYLDGVTSSIQGQFANITGILLPLKANLNGNTFSGTHDFSGGILRALTKPFGSSGNEVATLDFVNALAFNAIAFPGQAGNAGKYAKTNGASVSWEYVAGVAPIGTMMAIGGQATNPYLPGDGSTWLRSGTIALSSLYPLAPKTLYGVKGGDFPLADSLDNVTFVNGNFVKSRNSGVSISADGQTWTHYPYPSGYSTLGATSIAFVGTTWVLHYSGTTGYTATNLNFSDLTRVTFPASFAKVKTVNGVMFGFVSTSVAYCYTSTDGINWTQRTLPSAQTWFDVAYTGTTYVIVANSSTSTAVATTIATWGDGGALGGTYSTVSIAFGNTNTLVATGTFAGGFGYSYSTNNGTSWTGADFATSSGGRGIVWTGTKFVTGSASVAYITSSNGVAFTEVASGAVPGLANQSIGGLINYLASDGAGKVLGGVNQFWFYSSDHAATFSRIGWLYPEFSNFNAVAGNANYAVVARYNTNYVSLVTRSGASISTKVVACGITNAGSIACNGNTFVVTNDTGATTARRSTDGGATWSNVVLSQSVIASGNATQCLASVGAIFVGCSASTTGTISNDNGASWTNVTFPAAFRNICSNSSIFVAFPAGGSTQYYTSTDGITWTPRNFPLQVTGTTQFAGWDGVRFSFYATDSTVASGFSLYTSTDGINWTSKPLPIDAYQSGSIAYTNPTMNGIVIFYRPASTQAAIATKDGGATWIYQHFSANETNGFVATNTLFVLSGYYKGSDWYDVSTDYCGYPIRRNFEFTSISNSNVDMLTSPTYYMRVA